MTAPEHDIGRGETPDVSTLAVTMTMAVVLATLVLSVFGLAWFFHDRIGIDFADRHPFPAPGVSAEERTTRALLESRQQAELSGAGGRTPIDAAMKAIAARGPHAFDPLEGSQ